MTQALERMLDDVQGLQILDVYAVGLSQMYSGPIGPGPMGAQPFLVGYDMPGTGTQLHLHGQNLNTITHGHIVPYGHSPGQRPLVELNGFDASMASLRAENLGFKKFP